MIKTSAGRRVGVEAESNTEAASFLEFTNKSAKG